MNLLRHTIILSIVLISSCQRACPKDALFDPKAPLQQKLDSVSSWLPEEPNLILIVDVPVVAATPFYNETITGLKDIAGILIYADGLLFIGGSFDKENIKASLATDGVGVNEEVYKKKRLYTAEDTSMAILEDHLVCYGEKGKIKWIIDSGAKKPKALKIDSPIFAALQNLNKKYIDASFTTVAATGNINALLNINVVASFPNKNEAEEFMGSLSGFKALGIIKLLDDPAASAIINRIEFKQEASNVKASVSLNADEFRMLLAKIL